MRTVRDILAHKGSQVFTISPDDSVYDALVELARRDIGALIVVENGKVVGILSERDYARKVILRGESSRELKVRKIMTHRPVCVGPSHGVEECMEIMTTCKVRHLPVLDQARLVGVISIGDVVKAMIEEREETIQHLENYIRQGG